MGCLKICAYLQRNTNFDSHYGKTNFINKMLALNLFKLCKPKSYKIVGA